MSPALVLLAPMGIEAFYARRGAPTARIERVGIGPKRAGAALERLSPNGVLGNGDALAVLGFGGGLVPGTTPGDVVVASELLGEDGQAVARLEGAEELATLLRGVDLTVHVGGVASLPRFVHGDVERARLASGGCLAVDMESAWLAPLGAGRPFAVVRALSDVPGRRLLTPATILSLHAAGRSLARAASVLRRWAVLGPTTGEVEGQAAGGSPLGSSAEVS